MRTNYIQTKPGAGHDVVVLGGGPAGCAAALALKRRGISSVLVVESSRYESDRIGESIPPDTGLLLDKLGILEDFLAEKHESCLGSCSSWGDDELGYNDFLFNPFGSGWHLNRRRFDSFLARKAEESGAELCTGTRFIDGYPVDVGFRLKLAGDDPEPITVTARFVVDATGMRSSFARRMGARRVLLDRLICVFGFFQLPAAARFSKLTMLEAVEYGWWYAARLPNNRLAVAVAGDAEFIRQAALTGKKNWLRYLSQTRHLSRETEDGALLDDNLRVCSAPSFLLDKTAGPRWLAVGDAASAYDPISSQGIYKAISDGLQAAEVISALFTGETNKLNEYQDAIADNFDGYLANRNYFYAAEKRWPASPFWKRRAERAAL